LPIGAQVKPSKELYQALLPLKEKIIYILPDNDQPGREYAKKIKQVLNNLEIESQIIPIPDLGEKSDVADFIELEILKGKSKDEIRKEILNWVDYKKEQALYKVSYLNIHEIMTKEVKEPNWIIQGLLPEGFSILAGKPKVGKSWLALQIALTCALNGKRVVYFALEDNIQRLQRRLKTLGIPEEKNIPIVFSFALSQVGRGAVKEIKTCIQEFKPDLIIIDPWAKIKPKIRGKDMFLEEYKALDIFKKFSQEGVSLLLIHHTRKTQAEDPIDEILGSTGQTAVVDNILVLKRARGTQTAVLHLILRDFEGTDLGLRFENGWKVEGTAEEVKLGEGQREVLEAIKKLEEMGEKATIKVIAEITGKSTGDVRFLLYKLSQKGLIERTQKGTYSLCKNKNINTANSTNSTNTTNSTNMLTLLTLLTPQTSPAFVSDVSDRVLTFLSQKNQGLGEFVSDVSTVSTNINCYSSHSTPDPDLPPIPFDTKSERTPDKTKEPEEVVYLLMPKEKACERCKCEVWVVQKRDYGKRVDYGRCAKCGHVSFLGDLSKGRLLNKTDVEYFLDLP
jgi:hypothetical protein